MNNVHPLVLVTGSSDGIGLETARQLARHGANVIIHGRRHDRVVAAQVAVAEFCGRPLPAPIIGDLSSIAGATQLAADLASRALYPSVLVNNAGVFCNQPTRSIDGIELTMAINHFGHAALTLAMLADPRNQLRRIVNVSSIAHNRGRIDLDDITLTKRRFDGYAMYAASKLANVLFTVALAERLRGRVAVNALHPGVVSTKLLQEGFGMTGPDSVADGAATSVMLALDPEYADVTGQYFAARRVAPVNPVAQDHKFCHDFLVATEQILAEAKKQKGPPVA